MYTAGYSGFGIITDPKHPEVATDLACLEILPEPQRLTTDFYNTYIEGRDVLSFRQGSTFSTTTAEAATHIFAYWALSPFPQDLFKDDKGKYKPPSTTALSERHAAQWGRVQGTMAAMSAMMGPYKRIAPSLSNAILFVDVEEQPPPGGEGIRRKVFEGFLDALSHYGFVAGVYTNTSAWNAWFGQDLIYSDGFVLWTADDQQSSDNASPTVLLPDCLTLDSFFFEPSNKIGGQFPVIWQYAGAADPSADGGDWNVSCQNPANFQIPRSPPSWCGADLTPTPTSTVVPGG